MIGDLRRKLFGPTQAELVQALIAGTSSLELVKGEFRKLAPLPQPIMWCQFVKIEGNALPTFTYAVFDNKTMNFVNVHVSLSLPDKILFDCIQQDDGITVAPVKLHTKPFKILSKHLYRYFPLPPEPKEPARAL